MPASDQSPTFSIPRLQTARLLLREYRMEDFDAFAGHVADAEANKFIGASDRRNAWRIFGCQTGQWMLQGAGWWAVELRETRELVGTVGAFFREGWPELELGWNTHRAFWGRGYAREAATEMVRHAFEDRSEPRVTALIAAENSSSLRVAEHLGMRHQMDTELFGTPVGRYTRGPRAE